MATTLARCTDDTPADSRCEHGGVRMIAAVLAGLLVAAPASGVVCTLADPRITEASGLGIGRLHPGVLYVQNDSGDSARCFAVDAATGRTRAVLTVPGATNVDWEDLAVAEVGRRSRIYLADIGDNDGVRAEVRIYRVDEPAELRSGPTSRPDVWRLRYPTGPVDAEALAVAPGGAAYVVTKSPIGRSEVYAVPPRPDAGAVQVLRPVAPFRPVGAGAVALSVTGASFSADGRVFALRTYADAYLWHVHDGDLAAALRTPPVRVVLPGQLQGEGIAVDTDRLLLDSEGAGSAVLAVPLPAGFATTPAGSPSPTPSPPPSDRGPSAGVSTPPQHVRGGHRPPTWAWPIAAVTGVGLAARLGLLLRRRHRRSPR
ncbi:MAG: hypothetical protein ACTHMS_23785 [Jatrophihabitans sp.]|uniref:hypothetical protein n=1 Tax=Jatrophihabitans sp. TaxID=1932789 RepID=UPI003F7F6372